MPFIARGTTVAFVRADEKPLAVLLDELRQKKFTGRVEFNVTCEETRYAGAVELQNGRVVAAELETPSLIRGIEALRLILNRWLQNCRGYAEIIELDEPRVKIDLEENPTARLDPNEADQAIDETLRVLRELMGEEKRVEEVAPTAPLVELPEAKPAEEHATSVEEVEAKPSEETLPTPEVKPEEAVAVEAVPSTSEIIERLDSPLFDASIVLHGILTDSGYVQPHEIDKLVTKIVEISKKNPDKTVVAFVNDRLNEIKAKLVAHDGMLVAALARRDSERLIDKDALEALAKFERPLLYDVYLVGPDVDETLHRLAQEAVRRAREEAARMEQQVVEETPAPEKQSPAQPAEAPEERGEEAREERRKRCRFLLFFRR